MPTDISPSASQRATIGAVVKMIQDPADYKRLILFGATGAVICDDHTASSPKWRSVKLNAAANLTSKANFTYTHGTGPASVSVGDVITMTSTNSAADFDYISFQTDACITMAITAQDNWNPFTGAGDDRVDYTDCSSVFTQHNGASGFNPTDLSHTQQIGPGSPPGQGSFQCVTHTSLGHVTLHITILTIAGSSNNDMTFFGDMQGSINRKGWFGWLGQDGSDIWFYYTTNYFQTRKRVLVASYDSNKIYSIGVGSYGTLSRGVVLVSAGTSVYKSTNYGSSFSNLAVVVNDSGGILVMPFAKNGGAANAGTSPQYLLVKGVSTNLQARSLAGSTVTLAAGSSHVPVGPYSLYVYSQDGAYCWMIASDGTFWTSVDGGGTWTQQATPTHTGSVYGATGSPKNLAFALAFGNQCLAYSADSGAAWTSMHSAYRTWADANIGSGKAQTIVSAFIDLSLLYSKSVTQ